MVLIPEFEKNFSEQKSAPKRKMRFLTVRKIRRYLS